MPTDADLPLAARLRWTASFIAEHFLPLKSAAAEKLARGRRALIAETAKTPPARAPLKARALDEDAAISPASFRRRYMRGSRPFVFRGAAKSWKCSRGWSLDLFAERYAQDQVRVIDLVGVGYGTTGEGYAMTSMAEFAKRVRAGKSDYIRFASLTLDHPELAEDLDHQWLRRWHGWAPRGELQFFIGGPGTSTPMHCAGANNFFIQVAGRKRWRLWSPNTLLFMDPPAARLPYFYSAANPDLPDAARYPLFPLVDEYEVTLEPGDVMWIPPYWWHYVENLSQVTIGVGYRTASLPTALRSSTILTSMRFLARNPSIVTSLLGLLTKKHMMHTTLDSRTP